MELTKIEKKNLVDEVYKQMREMIVSGTWKEGDKLASEHQLTTYFDVSRVVVREALQRLRTEHLILTRQGMGSFVSNPRNFITNLGTNSLNPTVDLSMSESEFMDLMELRRCLEFHAIELSAVRATDEDFARVTQALEMMKQSEHDTDAFSQADYNFHYAIIQSAHNVMFCRAMDSCKDLVYYCFREMNRVSDFQWGISMHQAAAERFLQRDAAGTIRSLKKNNEYNHARLLEFFQNQKQKKLI